MKHLASTINRSHRGFTLIEILVAIAIMAIIIGPLTMSISQVISVNASSVSREMVFKSIENAVQYISRDTQQAQTITTNGGTLPLKLTWKTFGQVTHVVTYSLNGDILMRSEKINGLQASNQMIADYMDTTPGMITCSWSSGTLTLKISTSIGGFKPASETRTVQIGARSAH